MGMGMGTGLANPMGMGIGMGMIFENGHGCGYSSIRPYRPTSIPIQNYNLDITIC